jgi:ribosomal protein S18 acetylase RimI-like enzyme
VAPAARRRGIGSALLAFVERRARQRGCIALTCVAPDTDAAARSFLDRAGMAPTGQHFVKPLRD